MKKKKVAVFVLLFLLVIACLGLGSYFIYENFFTKDFIDTSHSSDVKKEKIQNELKVKTIKETILNNQNLSEEEKELFLKSEQFFVDQVKYCNYDKVIGQLKNLRIVYRSDIDLVGDATGEYDYEVNTINIFGVKSFDDADKSVLTHEFIHVFTDFTNFTTGKGFYEVLTVIMNNEYFKEEGKYDVAYSWLLHYGYVLGEIVGTDNLWKFYKDIDVGVLVGVLEKIINDTEKASILIQDMDYLSRSPLARENDSEKKEKEEEVEQILKEYYEAKFHLKINASLYLSYFFDQDRALSNISKKTVEDFFTASVFAKFVEVKEYRKLFLKPDKDNYMILKVCTKAEVEEKIFSKKEYEERYRSFPDFQKRIIDYIILNNGDYKVQMVVVKNYTEYKVKSFELQ